MNVFKEGARVVLMKRLKSLPQIVAGDTGTVVGIMQLENVVNARGEPVPELPRVQFDKTGQVIGVNPDILAFVA